MLNIHISLHVCIYLFFFILIREKKVGKGRFHYNSPLARLPTSIMQKTKPQDLHGYAYLYQPRKGGTSLPTNELLFLFASILHDHSQECSLHHIAIFPRLRTFPPFPPHQNPKGTHANFPSCPAEILSNPFSCRNEQYDSLITFMNIQYPTLQLALNCILSQSFSISLHGSALRSHLWTNNPFLFSGCWYHSKQH